MGSIVSLGKYMARQAKYIAQYGEKSVERTGVTRELLDEVTPFRRLSAKKGVLSDPKYFIENFEKENGNRFLPQNWSTLSPEDKMDYIVKDRYSKLVSNKIMNKIKNEPEEHLYLLNKDGDIALYSKGDGGYCDDVIIKGGTSIHNHPGYLKTYYSPDEVKYIEKHCPERVKGVTPFSDSDIFTSLGGEKSAYVVDSQSHKFLFKPRQDITDAKESTLSSIKMRWDIASLAERVFPSSKNQKESVKLTNNLLEKVKIYESKQKKWGRLFYPERKRDKLFGEYITAKIDTLSMKPYEEINRGLKEICEEYGHKYEQLS